MVGAKPFPAATPGDSGIEMMRPFLRSDEYMDLEDVVNVASFYALTGGAAVGATFRGGRAGTIAGAAYTVGATIFTVVIHSTMVYLHYRDSAGVPTPGQPSDFFYVNGQLSSYVPNVGTYTIPSIAAPGGGRHFVISTYLLL